MYKYKYRYKYKYCIVGSLLWMGMITTAEAGKITLIYPTSGTVGTIITVKGEGYIPSETIRIDLPAQFGAATTQCSDKGTFSTSFILGKHPAGINKFVVVGFTSYALDSGTITVKSRIKLITPTSGKVGEFVTIEGDGYGAEEEIRVSFGKNPEIKTVLTDAQGGFIAVFTTDTQPAGVKKIIVTGLDSKETNSTQYILQGSIQTVIPTHGYVGTTVTVEGVGFGKEEVIRVDFGKIKGIVYTTSQADGKFSCVFTVSPQPQGRKDITVTGIYTGEQDTAGFVITPHIRLVTPTSGTVGSTIIVVATGFGSSEPIRIDLGRALAVGRTESNEDGVVEAQIKVTSQVGKTPRRLAVVGIRSRQISFTDVFTILPSIKITPTMGEVETNIHVQGEGFAGNELVRIDFGKITTVGIATVDERMGNFEVWFKVPPHPGGKVNIVVTSLSDGEKLIEEFTITPRIKLISPDISGRLGDRIEIQGDGFAVNEVIQVDLGRTEGIATGVTDAEGNFAVTFEVDDQPGGKKTCTVRGMSSGVQESTTFDIKGKMLISPTSGVYGTVVEIKGNGYSPFEPIRVDFGGSTKIASLTADANGAFITNFKVDTKTSGEVRVRTIGLESWIFNIAAFTVLEEKREKSE